MRNIYYAMRGVISEASIKVGVNKSSTAGRPATADHGDLVPTSRRRLSRPLLVYLLLRILIQRYYIYPLQPNFRPDKYVIKLLTRTIYT